MMLKSLGPVLSPILFIIVLWDLSHNLNIHIPWEHLYADDLVIVTEALKLCWETKELEVWLAGNVIEYEHGYD